MDFHTLESKSPKGDAGDTHARDGFDQRRTTSSDDEDFDDEETNHGHPDADKKSLSLLGIWIVTLGLLAVEFEWSILYVHGSPLLRQLGTSHVWVGIAWCVSPILIIFIQPILGVMSDRCEHRWGRRKPFLAVSALAALISMVLIPNAKDLAFFFFPESMQHNGAIMIAMLGVMTLDLTNELVYYFLRALLVDVLPSHQSEQGNSMSSFMMSIGGLAGNLVASRDIHAYFPILPSNVHICFFIGKVLFILILTVKNTYITEKPYRRRSRSKQASWKQAVYEVFYFMKNPPQGLLQLCVVDFFSWVSLFGFFMFITEWMGEAVYQGDPTSSDPEKQKRFEEGVREGATDLAVANIVISLFAPVLPTIIKKVGLKATYFYAHILLGTCLIMTMAVKTSSGALLLISLVGIPFSVDETIPYVYISHLSGDKNTGLYIAVLQNFAVGAKMFISIGMGEVVTLFNGSMTAAMVFAGLSAFIAAGLITRLPDFDVRTERISAH